MIYTLVAIGVFLLMEPITWVSLPSAVRQKGNGIPQKRDLERFQSFALDNQFPKRPSPVDLGFQLISLLIRIYI